VARVAERSEVVRREARPLGAIQYSANVSYPSIDASMAKVYAPTAALFATQVAMDVAGLAGVRNDSLIEKCFRDVKVFDIFEGTGEVQRIVLARRLFGYPRSSPQPAASASGR